MRTTLAAETALFGLVLAAAVIAATRADYSVLVWQAAVLVLLGNRVAAGFTAVTARKEVSPIGDD